MEQFDKQRGRGTQGFGLFDGQEKHIVKASKEDSILRWLCKYNSHTLLFHHRFPTSTINCKRCSHPFSTKDYFKDVQYILVHNGHISNSRTLRQKHSDLGIAYQSELQDGTFNDSEALLWDLALYLEGKQDSVTAYGGLAFIAIKLVKGKMDKLYFGANNNPLNLLRKKKDIFLSSEGEGQRIESDVLYTWNYKTNRLTTRKVVFPRFDSSYSQSRLPASSGYYNHYDYDDDDEYSQQSILGYRKNEYGVWIKEDDQPKESDEWWFDDDVYKPTAYEIMTCVENYLIKSRGIFEQAYTSMEIDYISLEEELDAADNNPSPGVVRQIRLLEGAMQDLCADTEWLEEDSVSSLWRNICKQI